jgi:hypothetical protein
MDATVIAGSVLCDPGTWTELPAYSYQWQRDTLGNGVFVDLPGETERTRLISLADLGSQLRCKVIASTYAGAATMYTPGLMIDSLGHYVSTSGTWTESPAIAYQWQRDQQRHGNFVDIAGQTSNTHYVTAADGGCNLRCKVTATNYAGAATVYSNLVALPGTPTRVLAATVEIAFDAYVVGVFTIDHSGLDSNDGLFDGNAQAFTGTFDDVTDDVDQDVQIAIGTDDLAGAVQASTCDFALIRPDDVGQWNPKNPGSDVNQLDPGLIEMRPVRVTVNNGAGDHGLFWGFLRTATFDAASGLLHVHCEDLIFMANRWKPVIASTGPTTTGAVIGLVLDYIGWTDQTLRDLDVGDHIPDFSADGSRTAPQIIADLLAAERGTFYQDPDNGVATYRSRDYPQLNNVYARLANQLSDLGADLDADRVYTRVTVSRSGGASYTAVDTTAERRTGGNELPSIDSPYIPDDTAPRLLAGDLIYEKKQPSAPVRPLLENDSELACALQLRLRPLDPIDVVEDLAGTDGTYSLQQIKHAIDVQGFYLRTDALATPRPLMSFAIDVSGLDGPDEIRY